MRVPPADVIAAAQACQHTTGILASVTLGQWALESAWGTKATGRNNFFGIKGVAGQPSTMCWTHEFVGGKSVPAQQPFADYPTLDAGFAAHGRLLSGGRYVNAWGVRSNRAAFVHAIAPIYATDPDYGDKLLDLIRTQKFDHYDVAPTDFGADLTHDALEA